MEPTGPVRKSIRLKEYNYAAAGAYFVTVCVKDRQPLLWENVGADIIRPPTLPLSPLGRVVDAAIQQIPAHYPCITVDQYCIMPDHIHLLLVIHADANGRQVAAPTLSTVVGQMKRWASVQAGFSLWQKSFTDRVIRNEAGYLAVWEYIQSNPIRMVRSEDRIDFSQM